MLKYIHQGEIISIFAIYFQSSLQANIYTVFMHESNEKNLLYFKINNIDNTDKVYTILSEYIDLKVSKISYM